LAFVLKEAAVTGLALTPELKTKFWLASTETVRVEERKADCNLFCISEANAVRLVSPGVGVMV